MSAELAYVLDRINLQEYLPALVENGFDTWDVVCDITEDDLAHLGFKLGHRRILQREIAASRGSSHDHPLGSRSTSQSPNTMAAPEKPTGCPSSTPHTEERTKRRYRRKPRPDINAPKKPKTAYVNFADTLRTDPQISSLSFVEIAREVGRRWQALPPDQKHAWECQAARDMQEYEAQMDEYKTTENYRRYQHYLKSFRNDRPRGKKPRTGPRPALDQGRKSRSNSSETLSVGSGEVISSRRFANFQIEEQMLEDSESETLDSDDVKRLVCTLVFMECWLSTTLGYKADVRTEDITRACSIHEISPNVTDAIYYQACKIGLVSREIANITLDGWYKELPANMHLAALTDEKQSACLTFYQRRAILMVHMFYLGAIISVYRQLLLQACQARIQSKWNLDNAVLADSKLPNALFNSCAANGAHDAAHKLHRCYDQALLGDDLLGFPFLHGNPLRHCATNVGQEANNN
ncbi:putative hmg box protein [Botryosphaeria dothidea]|uniref:Hmg box protein n=1 Tax=Botryosphaeria dothidea TaxID=55169 RepID=A0A8H4IHM7_9PEZI|nr:putative hmg box protein [Botryosphaeria dothidea]